MMSKKLLILILGLFGIAAADPVFAMRCGNRVIGIGDHQIKVRSMCGEPAMERARTIYRAGIPRRYSLFTDQYNSSLSDRELLVHNRSVVEVPVQTWIYNFGPRRLMREVVFENDRIIEIRVLGYGYSRAYHH